MKYTSFIATLAASAALSFAAHAKEFPIGTPHKLAGMEIAAVYLAPIKMEPEGMMRKAEESDIHLEADIHALKDHPNGFEEGAWMPHLSIDFELVKLGTTEKVSGHFMPMVASDGPGFKPFDVSYEFTFAGTGKKGGY